MVWLIFHILAGAAVVLALQLIVNIWRRLPNNWGNLTSRAPLRWAAPLLVALLLDVTVIYVATSALVAIAMVMLALRRRSGVAEDILSQERLFITILVGLTPIVMVTLTLASPFISMALAAHLWLRAMMIGGFLLTILQLVSTFWYAQRERTLSASASGDDSTA